MPAASDRLDFAPPPQPALVRAFVLALLAHLLLLGALTWGVNWKRETQDAAIEAELWSALPQEAAPAPPPPAPAPAPVPVPTPAPEPVVKPPPQPEPPQVNEPDIALEKKKKAAEAKQRAEDAERRKLEAKRKLEAQKLAQEKRREDAERVAAQQRKEDAEQKARQQKADAAAKQKEQQHQQAMAKQREDRIRALQGMAGATGGPTATGVAQRSSGPSDSWAGRVRARVRPNIVFSDDAAGNPEAHVEVRLAPDGTIVGKRIVRTSGTRAWDEAVLRAIDKTEVLPRDTDGRVPSPVVLVFRPKD